MEMHPTHTHTHTHTHKILAYSHTLLAKQTNKQDTHTHSQKPLGNEFHFISRAGEERAGESIHAVSSCAEGGFAAMETDAARLQSAGLI